MVDPLAEIVALLQPSAGLSKLVEGAGRWAVRRTELGQPFYRVILDGSCRLDIDGHRRHDVRVRPVGRHAGECCHAGAR